MTAPPAALSHFQRYLPRLLPVLLLAAVLPVAAVELLRLQVGEVTGEAWGLKGLALTLTFTGSGAELDLDTGNLTLPPPYDGLTGATLRCPETVLESGGFRCPQGMLALRGSGVTNKALPVALAYEAGRWSFSLRSARLAGGRLQGKGHFDGAGWDLELQADSVDASSLAPLVTALAALPAPLIPGRRITGRLTLQGDGRGVAGLSARGSVEGLGYSDPDGLYVAEGLALKGELSVRRERKGWRVRSDLRATGGQGYVDPVYVDFGQAPLRLQLDGEFSPTDRALQLANLRLDHGPLLALEAKGRLVSKGSDLELSFAGGDLGAGFATYGKPFLVGTVADALTLRGRATGTATVAGGRLVQGKVELAGVHMEDGDGRFGVSDLGGTLAWERGKAAGPSRIAWSGGHLFAVPLGSAELNLEAGAGAVRLLEPLDLPVLDGALHLVSFRLSGLEEATPELVLDAGLEAVSLEALSGALEWPPLSGRLSGAIPSAHYHGGVLEVGGALQVQAFNGELVVRNLRLEDPFGVVPRLGADVDLAALDLDALTRTFAFGTIQGALEGHIHGLRLENWAPVAFDAAFRTPPGDPSRHRISQRAVENLTSLGGGVTGALSRGVLRFFEEFSYSELGLSCRLARGVCYMGGIGDTDGGYVIVKGGGLPRIDVVGYSREVDWEVLVARLKRITAQANPVIE